MRFEPIEGVCVLDDKSCRRNVRLSLRRGLRVCGWSPKRVGSLAIVGSGPSVSGYLGELKEWPGEIWAINGAYRYLIENGVHVHGFVGLDPVPGLKEYVEVRRGHTTFLLASVCDPSVFDELKDEDVWLWHSKQGELFRYPKGSQVVGGGTTCLTRAPFLAHMVGWRDITVYGADSSFDEDAYCYRTGAFREDTTRPRIPVEVAGTNKVFWTEANLLKQVSVFGVMMRMFNETHPILKMRCGGLMQAFLDSPMYEIRDAA